MYLRIWFCPKDFEVALFSVFDLFENFILSNKIPKWPVLSVFDIFSYLNFLFFLEHFKVARI